MRSESLTSLGKAGFYILLPGTFLVVPTSLIEARRPICLIRTFFVVKCLGCGMTRVISCVFHGKFKQAFEYNKLIIVVFPLLCYVWVRAIRTEYKKYIH